jgi:hypothetical protein
VFERRETSIREARGKCASTEPAFLDELTTFTRDSGK